MSYNGTSACFMTKATETAWEVEVSPVAIGAQKVKIRCLGYINHLSKIDLAGVLA